MIDIRFLRENAETVRENIRKKFEDHKLPLVDEVIDLDKRNREIKQEVQSRQADAGGKERRGDGDQGRDRQKRIPD